MKARLLLRIRHGVVGPQTLRVSLLTGGGDKPYALGLTGALTAEGVSLDFIGSDDLAVPELLSNPGSISSICAAIRARKRVSRQRRSGLDLLRAADSLRGDGEAENLPHPVEQQIRILRSHGADALLPIAGQTDRT